MKTQALVGTCGFADSQAKTFGDFAIVGRVVTDLALMHGMDPFLRRPLGRGMGYFRLHGRPAYHYRGTNADLVALWDMVSRTGPNRVLFNNDSMAEDAKRFIQLLTRSS